MSLNKTVKPNAAAAADEQMALDHQSMTMQGTGLLCYMHSHCTNGMFQNGMHLYFC